MIMKKDREDSNGPCGKTEMICIKEGFVMKNRDRMAEGSYLADFLRERYDNRSVN